jgi:osmotically-inducible protein OsmY
MNGPRWRGLVLLGLLGMIGCQQKDADQLGRVARKAAEKVQAAAGGAQEPLNSGVQLMKANIDELSPESRVAVRLRWDKDLSSAPIKVKAVGGVVELRGSVATNELKQRAVMLAKSTIGVEKVSDGLEVMGTTPP